MQRKLTMTRQAWTTLFFILLVVKTTFGQYQCYVCDGDPSATLSNPDFIIDLSPLGINQQVPCLTLQTSLASGAFTTEDQCNQILSDPRSDDLQRDCGCSNYVAPASPVTPAPVATPVATPAPVASPVTPAPVTASVTPAPVTASVTPAPVASPVTPAPVVTSGLQTPAPVGTPAPQAPVSSSVRTPQASSVRVRGNGRTYERGNGRQNGK